MMNCRSKESNENIKDLAIIVMDEFYFFAFGTLM